VKYHIKFKASARKSLRKISDQDRKRILIKIITLEENPRPIGSIKLTNHEAYRFRQEAYRIIYTIQDSELIIEIIRIGHRRDIYD